MPVLLYMHWNEDGLHNAAAQSTFFLLRASRLRVCASCPERVMNGSGGCETDRLQWHCAGIAVWFASRCLQPPVAAAGQPLPDSTADDSLEAATARQVPLKHACQW